MNYMKRFYFLLLLLPVIAQAQFSKDLKKLAGLMQGTYSSEEQHLLDTTYYNIRLKIVPIWSDRSDARWMYVEQALVGKEERPYRQRVYKLTEPQKGQFESAVYTLQSPLRFVGHINFVEKLNPDSLQLRDGCSVFMKKVGKKKFDGKTDDKKCPSDMRNAAYASSIVSITPGMLISWDRGYDRDNRQVWGAEKGGYRFRKIKK